MRLISQQDETLKLLYIRFKFFAEDEYLANRKFKKSCLSNFHKRRFKGATSRTERQFFQVIFVICLDLPQS